MDQSVEAISAIPARMNEAWNRGDATAFFSDFADDAEFADFEGTIYRGREQMIATHQTIFDTVMKGSRLLHGEVSFARLIGPTCGVVHHRVGIVMPGEQETPPKRFSMQLFVVSWNDGWQVVALQNSRLISLDTLMVLESL